MESGAYQAPRCFSCSHLFASRPHNLIAWNRLTRHGYTRQQWNYLMYFCMVSKVTRLTQDINTEEEIIFVNYLKGLQNEGRQVWFQDITKLKTLQVRLCTIIHFTENIISVKLNLSFSIHIYYCGNTLFCCARRPLAVGYWADSDAPCCWPDDWGPRLFRLTRK